MIVVMAMDSNRGWARSGPEEIRRAKAVAEKAMALAVSAVKPPEQRLFRRKICSVNRFPDRNKGDSFTPPFTYTGSRSSWKRGRKAGIYKSLVGVSHKKVIGDPVFVPCFYYVKGTRSCRGLHVPLHLHSSGPGIQPNCRLWYLSYWPSNNPDNDKDGAFRAAPSLGYRWLRPMGTEDGRDRI